MRFLLVLTLVLGVHITTHAHKFYFAFAEVEYNYFTQRFEATVTTTTHDIESALKKEGHQIGNLELLDSLEQGIVEHYLNDGLVISSNGAACTFSLIGYEVHLDGTTNYYLESTEVALNDTINVKFDLLMDTYSEQQNKITLYYKEETYTVSFTITNQNQIIKIENKEE